MRKNFICGLAAALFASVIFIYFGAQNTSELSLKAITIISGLIFASACGFYLILLLLFKNAQSAFIFSIVWWVNFHLAPIIFPWTRSWWPFEHEHGLSFTVTFIAFAIALATALKVKKYKFNLKFIYMFIGVLAVIFMINFASLTTAFMQDSQARNTKLPFKSSFNINKNLSSPNIYWIHADGMLNFKAVSKYFGDNQDEFAVNLINLGFEINKSAAFNAQHSTRTAVPVLMNPYSYDNYLKDFINKNNKNLENKYALQILRMNSELQYALKSKKYAVNIIGTYDFYYPISGGNFWLTSQGMARRQIYPAEYLRDNFILAALSLEHVYLNKAAKNLLNIFKTYFTGSEYRANISEAKIREILLNAYDINSNPQLDFAAALYDILNGDYQEPRLTIIHDFTPHYHYTHGEDGSLKIKNLKNMNPLDYHSQHVWSGKVLINIIDMILKRDPDAVIIIQSDHGLHGNSEEDFKKAFGDDADILELWNSTMSAIRVPDKFKTGQEFYALQTPLNITRYLINNFVGAGNYEYISPDVQH